MVYKCENKLKTIIAYTQLRAAAFLGFHRSPHN